MAPGPTLLFPATGAGKHGWCLPAVAAGQTVAMFVDGSAEGAGGDGGTAATRNEGAIDVRAPWDVPRWLDQSAAWIWRLGVVGLAIWVFFRVFGMFRLVTVPILFALVLTALFWPIRRRLVAWGWPKFVASWVVLLLTIGSLVGVTWLATVGVRDQLEDSSNWRETRAEVDAWLVTGPLDLSTADIERLEQRIEDTLRSGAMSFGASRARSIGEVVGSMILTVILVFFFIKDGPSLWSFIVERVRPPRRAAVSDAGSAAFDALTGYAKGVAITGLVSAVLIGAVLVLLGVPLAVPLALLTFFGAFIPIVGATVVGGLSVVVTLVSLGVREAVIVAVATVIVQQVEGDVVLPLVMGSQIQLHPAVILTVLAAGGAIAGLIGALVAVPLSAMIVAALRSFSAAPYRSVLTSTGPDDPPG